MLQRVRRDQVQLGMFIHGFEGSWFDHPFWRRHFVITDPQELKAVRESGVEAIVIDTSKGVAPPPPPATRAAQKTSAADTPCSTAAELARANEIVSRSKQAIIDVFGQARLGKAVETARLAPLVEEIAGSIARNRAALISIARLKSRDEYTYLHSVAVSALMINLARHLRVDEPMVREAGMAGLLHDVGKMSIALELLNKPAALTTREYETMKTHSERGHALLAEAGGASPVVLDVCLHHHERIDGMGYPHGLKGRQISLFSRMAAVCDVYDAITSDRCYKAAWTPADAMAKMAALKGQLDTGVLSAFIQSVGIYPVGTLVRLSSERLAVVVDERPEDPTRPMVRAFYSVRDRRPIHPIDVPLAASGHGERIVAQEEPANWGLAHWPSLCMSLIAGLPEAA